MADARTLLVAALRRHADRTPQDPNDEDMRLDSDWWLSGHALLDAVRELEGHLTSALDAEDLLDVLLQDPTLRGLLALVERHWPEDADAR